MRNLSRAAKVRSSLPVEVDSRILKGILWYIIDQSILL